ncbi:MAG TPA: hypothetical protein VFW38_09110 [Solirubrobacteraceae bacterium]|nr:hypothetical protein [Solirubrobacteraceae bacterium]
MTNLDSAHTPEHRAIQATLKAIDEPDRYLDGTSFLAADLPSFDEHFRRLTRERRPVVVVLPDGDELLLTPHRRRSAAAIDRLFQSLTRFLDRGPSDQGPLVSTGVPGEPFDVPLVRLTAAGYETHLHGLRR